MSNYFRTSRNNHDNRMKLIKFIRETGAFGYLESTDTCECYICERRLHLSKHYANTADMECDHINPISAFPIDNPDPNVKAEAYSMANQVYNLGPLCRQCNRAKRDSMHPVFITRAIISRNRHVVKEV